MNKKNVVNNKAPASSDKIKTSEKTYLVEGERVVINGKVNAYLLNKFFSSPVKILESSISVILNL